MFDVNRNCLRLKVFASRVKFYPVQSCPMRTEGIHLERKEERRDINAGPRMIDVKLRCASDRTPVTYGQILEMVPKSKTSRAIRESSIF